MNPVDLISCGISVISVVAVVAAGGFMLRVVGGRRPANALQRSYFRAGHAHAGVLLILGLVLKLLIAMPGIAGWATAFADGPLYAALFIPAGFYFSVLGADPTTPNRWRYLIPVGAATLVIGLIGTGIALILAGAARL
ncbi:hypothetical protein [uncultured Amnibacterium sp.]|uniref:hypothetical protein n=1 Tax=uncultured Amnibacterium sp. TaxID=1631851 RepID=UPI0035CC07F1